MHLIHTLLSYRRANNSWDIKQYPLWLHCSPSPCPQQQHNPEVQMQCRKAILIPAAKRAAGRPCQPAPAPGHSNQAVIISYPHCKPATVLKAAGKRVGVTSNELQPCLQAVGQTYLKSRSKSSRVEPSSPQQSTALGSSSWQPGPDEQLLRQQKLLPTHTSMKGTPLPFRKVSPPPAYGAPQCIMPSGPAWWAARGHTGPTEHQVKQMLSWCGARMCTKALLATWAAQSPCYGHTGTAPRRALFEQTVVCPANTMARPLTLVIQHRQTAQRGQPASDRKLTENRLPLLRTSAFKNWKETEPCK